MSKRELYKWIKISGILSFIPVILITGTLAGYFIGEYLEKKLKTGSFILAVCIILGIAASIAEVVRIVRLALKINKKV